MFYLLNNSTDDFFIVWKGCMKYEICLESFLYKSWKNVSLKNYRFSSLETDQ